MRDSQTNTTIPKATTWRHAMLISSGWICFLLGFVGIFLPLLPTTIFWIIAAWCWLRSAPERANKLLAHPHFGCAISNFLNHGQISRKGKVFAASGISFGFIVWLLNQQPNITIALCIAMMFASIIAWIALRPEPKLAKS